MNGGTGFFSVSGKAQRAAGASPTTVCQQFLASLSPATIKALAKPEWQAWLARMHPAPITTSSSINVWMDVFASDVWSSDAAEDILLASGKHTIVLSSVSRAVLAHAQQHAHGAQLQCSVSYKAISAIVTAASAAKLSKQALEYARQAPRPIGLLHKELQARINDNLGRIKAAKRMPNDRAKIVAQQTLLQEWLLLQLGYLPSKEGDIEGLSAFLRPEDLQDLVLVRSDQIDAVHQHLCTQQAAGNLHQRIVFIGVPQSILSVSGDEELWDMVLASKPQVRTLNQTGAVNGSAPLRIQLDVRVTQMFRKYLRGLSPAMKTHYMIKTLFSAPNAPSTVGASDQQLVGPQGTPLRIFYVRPFSDLGTAKRPGSPHTPMSMNQIRAMLHRTDPAALSVRQSQASVLETVSSKGGSKRRVVHIEVRTLDTSLYAHLRHHKFQVYVCGEQPWSLELASQPLYQLRLICAARRGNTSAVDVSGYYLVKTPR